MEGGAAMDGGAAADGLCMRGFADARGTVAVEDVAADGVICASSGA